MENQDSTLRPITDDPFFSPLHVRSLFIEELAFRNFPSTRTHVAELFPRSLTSLTTDPMTSGFEWATTPESFLRATQGRRGAYGHLATNQPAAVPAHPVSGPVLMETTNHPYQGMIMDICPQRDQKLLKRKFTGDNLLAHANDFQKRMCH